MAMNSKRTCIEFDCDDGIHYKLELTANSLKLAEKKGINFRTITDAPLSARQKIFWIACLKNHPTMTEKYATKLYESLALSAENKEVEYDEEGNEVNALDEVLIQMLDEAFREINGKQGNVKWSVT